MKCREFAAVDDLFKRACKLAGTDPTKRQAGKWWRKTGLAYKHRGAALHETMELQRMVQGEQKNSVKKEEEEVQK